MSWKNRAIPADQEAPKSSWKDRAESAAPVETEAERPLPKLGQTEAAVTSFGQGAGLGLTPIISGIVGAGANAVEQAGDALGLTTDSQLEEQGFTMPEKKTGLEGLMQAYYDSRGRQKDAENAAHEQYPVQSIVANIAGAIPTTIASGGATGAASKILPQADKFTKATGIGAKIAAGAREGAKAGALVGFGSGDAKLAEGEIADTAREVADSTVGGAVVGGAVPAAIGAVKGLSGIVSDLPIAKQIKTAFKGGQAGIGLNEDAAGNAIKTYSEDLLSEIQSQFRKAGMTKANAMDYADEVGIRIDAGETFQDVMDDIISKGASSTPDKLEKEALLKTFKELKEGPADKMADKLDTARAKMQQKMEAKGFGLLDDTTQKGHVQDFVPESGADKNLSLSKQVYQKIDNEPQDALEAITSGGEKAVSKPVEKLIQQAGDVNLIDINKYDLENLSMRDLEDVLSEVNRHTGDLSGPAVTSSQKIARKLAGQLRTLSEDALDNVGQESGNKSLSRTFSALGRAGIDDNVLTNNSVRKDAMVDKLRNTVTAGNPINRERMFQYLEEASPVYKDLDFSGKANFLNDFNDLAKNVKPLNSTNAMGLLGSAKNIGLTAANKAGAMSNHLTKLVDMPKETLSQIAQKMGMSTDKAAKQYASPLLKAAQADERQRAAILYGLYQQPAFRQAYENLGEGLNDIVLPVGTDRENNE